MARKPAQNVALPVVLTHAAQADLDAIFDVIVENTGPLAAHRMLDRLIERVTMLSHFPERGSYPRELIELGIREYRQTMLKPYRIIYRVHDAKVVVYLIADDRRELQSILAQRLLER